MRFTSSLLAFALGTATHTSSIYVSALTFPNITLGVDSYKHINPSNGIIDLPPKTGVLTQMEARSWTNARRLAAGRPLKPPTVIVKGTKTQKEHVPSATPTLSHIPAFIASAVAAAASAIASGGGQISSLSVSDAGSDTSCLQVFSSDSGSVLGYISNKFNGYGEYVLTPNMANCLVVTSPASPIQKGVKYDLQTRNGPDVDFPYIGIVEGDKTTNPATMGSSKEDYGILAAVVQRRYVSPSSRNSFSDRTRHTKGSQSIVWLIDTSTQGVQMNWENVDGSNMDVHIGLNENTFIVTGDKDAFTNTYGPTTWVNFKYIPV